MTYAVCNMQGLVLFRGWSRLEAIEEARRLWEINNKRYRVWEANKIIADFGGRSSWEQTELFPTI